MLFVSVLTPFNDYVMNNTPMAGNYLPAGVLLFYVGFLLLINTPMHRWAPRWAFSAGELAVALGMMLVSCGLPGTGLMRYLPTHLVSIWHFGGEDAGARQLLENLHLPDWIFPTMAATDPVGRAHDPVIQYFWMRAPLDNPTFWNYIKAVPWGAWLTPALTWGALLLGLWVMMLCLVVLVHRQWAENERLPFPLASVYLALIEPPEKGRALNGLFRARSFWLAAGAVLCVQALNGLHQYDPQHWPQIPLGYDLTALLSNRPWIFTDPWFKKATLYLSVIGLSYFVSSSLLFTIWFFVLALEAAKISYGSMGGDWALDANLDEMFGAAVPLSLAILWIGRHHWAMVLDQMLPRTRRPPGVKAGMQGGAPSYLPYRIAGYGLLGGGATVITWLWLAGCTLVGAIIVVATMLMLMLLALRIVAETGLLYVQTRVPLQQPFLVALQSFPQSLAVRPKLETFFFAALFSNLFTLDQRDAPVVFASQSLRVADLAIGPRRVAISALQQPEAAPRADDQEAPAGGRALYGLVPCLLAALVVGYLVSGASMLYCEYRYGTTLDRTNVAPINAPVYTYTSKELLLTRTAQMIPPGVGRVDRHNRLAHAAGGAGLTTALILLRLRFANWPLHPVGFFLLFTTPVYVMWFSLLVGWMIKSLILRCGGSRLYRASRALFIGLIIGEGLSAAFWLVVSLVRLAMGLPYERVLVG